MQFIFTEISEENQIIEVEYDAIGKGKYGIVGICRFSGETTYVQSSKLFFTKAEALRWCEFMTANKVLPSSLNQILSDEFYTHKIPQSSF